MIKAAVSVSQRDKEVIERVVVSCSNEIPYCLLVEKVKSKIKNISDRHIFYIGYCIGVIQGTFETSEQFHKQNNPLSKCRAN